MRGGSRALNRSEPLPHSQTAQILPPLKRQLAFESNKPLRASSNSFDQEPDSIAVKPLVSAAICLLTCLYSALLHNLLFASLVTCCFQTVYGFMYHCTFVVSACMF